MRRLLFAFSAVLCIASSGAALAQAHCSATNHPGEPDWRTPHGATDGRERAVLFGDPDAGSPFWTYRLRTIRPIQVQAHTHPVDEYITVLEGTWFFGIGESYEAAGLKKYVVGGFVHIPAGTPHFVATGENITVIQSSGSGQFRTDFISAK